MSHVESNFLTGVLLLLALFGIPPEDRSALIRILLVRRLGTSRDREMGLPSPPLKAGWAESPPAQTHASEPVFPIQGVGEGAPEVCLAVGESAPPLILGP